MANTIATSTLYGILSAKETGAAGNGVADDRAAIQAAINRVAATGGIVRIPAGTYLINGTLWLPGGVTLQGDGGRTRASVLKRAAGSVADLLVAGVYDGASHYRTSDSVWAGGTPYVSTANGQGIALVGLYLDGNKANAGTSNDHYRGSNVWCQWVDGVRVEDVFSDAAPNDCCFIGSCRRVVVNQSIFSNSGFTGINRSTGPTINGLTIAGTMVSLAGEESDQLLVSDCLFEGNRDLGCAIQARRMGGGATDPLYGGTVIVRGCISRNNGGYGFGVEASQTTSGYGVRNLILSDLISDGDCADPDALATASLLVGPFVYNAQLRGILIRNAHRTGLLVNGWERINVDQVLVENFGTSATSYANGVLVVADAALSSNTKAVLLRGIQVSGGGGRSVGTNGISVSGTDEVTISDCSVAGASAGDVYHGHGIYLSARKVGLISRCRVSGCDCAGIYLTGYPKAYQLSGNAVYNNGQLASSAIRAGIYVAAGPATTRHGVISGNQCYDDQTPATQGYGLVAPVTGGGDTVLAANNQYWGNATADTGTP